MFNCTDRPRASFSVNRQESEFGRRLSTRLLSVDADGNTILRSSSICQAVSTCPTIFMLLSLVIPLGMVALLIFTQNPLLAVDVGFSQFRVTSDSTTIQHDALAAALGDESIDPERIEVQSLSTQSFSSRNLHHILSKNSYSYIYDDYMTLFNNYNHSLFTNPSNSNEKLFSIVFPEMRSIQHQSKSLLMSMLQQHITPNINKFDDRQSFFDSSSPIFSKK